MSNKEIFKFGETVCIYDEINDMALDFGELLQNDLGENIVQIDSSHHRQRETYRLGDGVLMKKVANV